MKRAAAVATCLLAWHAVIAAPNPGNLFPVDFGADPAGTEDSTAALQSTINAAIMLGQNRSKSWPRVGAGALTIDLQGGVYLITAPLQLAWNATGFGMKGGSLIASSTSFPLGAFALDCEGCSQMAFAGLTVDMQHAGGCWHFDGALQVTLTDSFCLHYSNYGILGSESGAHGQGHELMVTSTFFAEFMWGEPGFDDITKQTGVGIWMDFPDSQFRDIIIRCTRVGVVSRAGANLWSGLHIYSTCNKNPDGYNVSVGFLSDAWQTRIHNCYFDDSPLVDTMLYGTTVSDSLIYGLSGLIIAPQSANVQPRGLFITHNVFTTTSYAAPTIHYDCGNGTVDATGLVNVVVAENSYDEEASERATRVTATVAVNGTNSAPTTLTVDLRDKLLLLCNNSAAPPPPPFDWRAAVAGPLADAAARGLMRRALGQTQSAAAVEAAVEAAGAATGERGLPLPRRTVPPPQQRQQQRQQQRSVASPIGGAIASATATGVLTVGNFKGMAGSSLSVAVQPAPADAPAGVLTLLVSAEGQTDAWEGLVYVTSEQQLPTATPPS